MPLLANAQVTVAAAPGTATITLGAATTGAQSWTAAGAADGAAYSYRIEEGAKWEIGTGTYTASGTKLARTTVLASSNGSAAETFGAGAIVSQVVLPADLPGIAAPYVTAESIGNPGYRKWSDGLIEQWGRVTFSGGADNPIYWPITLLAEIESLVAGVENSDAAGGTLYAVKVDAAGLTGANFRVRMASGSGVTFSGNGAVVSYNLKGR